jgi:hypothetical protein
VGGGSGKRGNDVTVVGDVEVSSGKREEENAKFWFLETLKRPALLITGSYIKK